jgi:hypothetical protein
VHDEKRSRETFQVEKKIDSKELALYGRGTDKELDSREA